jgi:hypothetical protein
MSSSYVDNKNSLHQHRSRKVNVPHVHLLPGYRPQSDVSLPPEYNPKFLACGILCENLPHFDWVSTSSTGDKYTNNLKCPRKLKSSGCKAGVSLYTQQTVGIQLLFRQHSPGFQMSYTHLHQYPLCADSRRFIQNIALYSGVVDLGSCHSKFRFWWLLICLTPVMHIWVVVYLTPDFYSALANIISIIITSNVRYISFPWMAFTLLIHIYLHSLSHLLWTIWCCFSVSSDIVHLCV